MSDLESLKINCQQSLQCLQFYSLFWKCHKKNLKDTRHQSLHNWHYNKRLIIFTVEQGLSIGHSHRRQHFTSNAFLDGLGIIFTFVSRSKLRSAQDSEHLGSAAVCLCLGRPLTAQTPLGSEQQRQPRDVTDKIPFVTWTLPVSRISESSRSFCRQLPHLIWVTSSNVHQEHPRRTLL